MRRVGLVVLPAFQVMSLAALSVFEVANGLAQTPAYDIHILSMDGGSIGSSFGMPVTTERFGDEPFDTIIVGGGLEVQPCPPELRESLRTAAASARRIASICTGAFVLAGVGLLDGRRVTTHWALAQELQARFPKAKVEPDRIFIADGPVWTSAGMSAGIDLALGMVEEDLGRDIALQAARKLVVYHRRAGGQSQHSALLDLEPRSDRIQNALTFARRNLDKPLSVERLAEAANLSVRQFSRAFASETGQSPAKAVERLRVEAARAMMEEGRHPIDVIARETGFADRERMRRAFLRAFGQPPQAIRRNARLQTAA